MLQTNISHYEITAKLGQGGMGEVYRAKDTKLKRDVAIKVLPSDFTSDPERLMRFQREAELLAALNHPNIATIHGLEESEGTKALILELVEGDTLGQRLKSGPLSLQSAIRTCLGIVEALEAAHDKGIIHRDLKPENVKLTSNDGVKVLDFGLGKVVSPNPDAMSQVEPAADLSTMTADYTQPGTVLGTAAYMAPEQARGMESDRRADIWAFGCVLFECLSGRSPFKGADRTDTTARIIQGEPEWSVLPPATPPSVKFLLKKCLIKDPHRRLQYIVDARIDLEQSLVDLSKPNPLVTQSSDDKVNPLRRFTNVAALILILILAGMAGWHLKPEEAPAPTQISSTKRAELLLSKEFELSPLGNPIAISRDGTRLVYDLVDGEGLRLRELDSGRDEVIEGTQGSILKSPFVSWNGDHVGLLLDDQLVTVPIDGGEAPLVLAKGISQAFSGGCWGPDGTIVFAEWNQPMKVVSENGGRISSVTELGDDSQHVFPQILPDGDRILFTALRIKEGVSGNPGRAVVINRKTGHQQEINIGECAYAFFVKEGHLIYAKAKGHQIWAIACDPETLTLRGEAKLVLSEVNRHHKDPQLAVATDGTLVYQRSTLIPSDERTLIWVEPDEDGVKTEPYTKETGNWAGFALSPDETKVAVTQDNELWLLEKTPDGSDTMIPLVSDKQVGKRLVWSPDSEWVYYGLKQGGHGQIWKKRIHSARGNDELLVCKTPEDPRLIDPTSLSSKIMTLVRQSVPSGDYDLLRFDLAGESTLPKVVYGNANYIEGLNDISPNGEWIAYYTSENGNEIYVAPMDGSRSGIPITTGTLGVRPHWAQDGKAIYFNGGSNIYKTEISINQNNSLIVQGRPQKIVALPYSIHDFNWTASRESERFLILVDTAEVEDRQDLPDDNKVSPAYLHLVTNWFNEIDERVPLEAK